MNDFHFVERRPVTQLSSRLTTFLGFHPKNPFGAFPKGFLRFISMSLEPIIEWTRL
jgi:hypothetical protein